MSLRQLVFRARIILAAAAALPGAAGLTPPALAAQAWPAEPIVIVVPFPPGGITDTLMRALGQKLGQGFNQPIIVENKPGGGTMIGAEAVKRAKPDGYTYGLIANSFTINPSLRKNMYYDSRKDFAPVTLMVHAPHILIGNPNAPGKTLKDLIAYARRNPGKLSFGSPGTGTSLHLAIESLKIQAGIDVAHIPYKGWTDMLNDLLGGHISYAFATLPEALPYLESGKIIALALPTHWRADGSMKNVSTMKELGFTDFTSSSWYGLTAPAGTPKEIIAKMATALHVALNEPNMKTHLTGQGFTVVGDTPEQFSAYLDAEFKKAETLVKASGATAN